MLQVIAFNHMVPNRDTLLDMVDRRYVSHPHGVDGGLVDWPAALRKLAITTRYEDPERDMVDRLKDLLGDGIVRWQDLRGNGIFAMDGTMEPFDPNNPLGLRASDTDGSESAGSMDDQSE